MILPGDILLKQSSYSLGNMGISLFQYFGRGPSKIVHAALANSNDTVIEMAEGKFTQNSLDEFDEVHDVFRCRVKRVADGAVEVARMMQKGDLAYYLHKKGMRISYRSGANPMVFRNVPCQSDLGSEALDSLLSARGASFFCSEFVVLCYQIAIEQSAIWGDFRTKEIAETFSYTSGAYLPSYLWHVLNRSPYFSKVGVVRSGEAIG